jgi:regulator of protease activity HflC (stomatin/prohibitin superfamily)
VNPFFEWLISIITEFKFWIIVQPWERCVLTRRGRDPRVLADGLHWRIPVIDATQTLNNRKRTYSFPSHTIVSRDRQAVTFAGVITFTIADPLQMHLSTKEPETLLCAVALRFMSEYVTSRDYADMSVPEMNEQLETELAAHTDGLTIEFAAVTEFGAFRTLRLLQESWRPYTGMDKHE